MFTMTIESQINISDRTLVCGIPAEYLIPKSIVIEQIKYRVIGISQGIKLPYISLEIEKTDNYLIGKKAVEVIDSVLYNQ